MGKLPQMARGEQEANCAGGDVSVAEGGGEMLGAGGGGAQKHGGV